MGPFAGYPDYEITAQLDSNQSHILYRALKKPENLPVILKTLVPGATPAQIARFFKEAEHLQVLNGAQGIVELHDTVKTGQLAALILKDIGGEPLHHVFISRRPSLPQFFHIAIRLTEMLEVIHSKGLIHQDINPANIIFSLKDNRVQIIDFDLTTVWNEELGPAPGRGQGTLGYMAPEQTGRTHRRVDFRSDFYSLGVTFYWLLSGRLPFTAETEMELVAQHLAMPAPRLDQVVPRLPAALVRIVDKLLQKAPEDRYQSDAGLRADLAYCQELCAKGESALDFTPGMRDQPLHLQLSSQLFGRETLRREMRNRLKEAVARQAVIWTVAGHAGVGKSRLVQAVAADLLAEGGVFCEGKFDPVNRAIPYFGWSLALGAWLRGLLTLPATELEQWRQTLNAAIGGRGKPLADMLPLLETVIGAQPDLPDVPGAEARNRFLFIFSGLLQCMASQGGPIIIFLDDIQWADDASLDLMETALMGRSLPGLLIIAAFRDEELGQSARAASLLERLGASGTAHISSNLASLTLASVGSLVAGNFKRDAHRASPLARLIHKKTAGNPYFIQQLLQSLFAAGELRFDSATGQWDWDIDAITRRPLALTAVELTVNRLNRLVPETQDVLRRAACMGVRFSPMDISLTLGKSEPAVRGMLAPALLEGFILPGGDGDYLFSHDRVRQAVYESISPDTRAATHLAIGRALFEKLPPAVARERLVELTTQLNFGAGLITSEEQRLRLAEINRDAETKARQNAAFTDAEHFIDMGIRLLPPAAWERNYSLAFDLHRDKAQILYLAQDQQAADRVVDLLTQKARTVVEKARLFRMRIAYHSVANNFATAIALSLDALREMGVDVPLNPAEQDIAAEQAALARVMGVDGLASLLRRPLAEDPEKAVLQDILVTALTPAYISNPPLFVLVALRLLRLTFEHGVTANTPAALVFYSAILAVRKRIDEAYDAGLLALRMLDRTDTRAVKARVLFLFATTIAHWRRPMEAALPELTQAVQAGIEAGDVEFAAYSLNHYHFQRIFMGRDLAAVIKGYEETRAAMEGLRQKMTLDHFNLIEQFVLNLGEGAADPALIKGARVDEAEEEKELIRTGNTFSLTALYMFQAFLRYFFGRKAEAKEKIAMALTHVASTTGMIHQPLEVFLQSLILGDYLESADEAATSEELETLRANAALYQSWAEKSEINYGSKRLMVEAALLRAGKQPLEEILPLYDEAARQSELRQNRWDQAIAHEQAAELLYARGLPRLALPYLRQAVFAYQLWGAHAKVNELEARFKDALDRDAQPEGGAADRSSSSSDRSLVRLDVETVVNASKAMSNISDLDELLVVIMKILTANAGAQTGYLLRPGPEGLVIEVQAGMGIPAKRLTPPVLAESSGLVSPAVARYVSRTGQKALLHDAEASAQFGADEYVRQKKIRSLLCMPLIVQREIQALLYLENNLASGAFTEEREELLNVLGAEAAISLRNATLFENLQKKTDSLKESESFLRALFEGTSAAVLLLDDSGILDCNHSTGRMFGVAGKAGIIGKRLADFTPERQPSGEASALVERRQIETARKQGASRFEWAMKGPENRLFYTEALLTPITYRDRAILHVIITDVDARVRFEKKNQELDEERRFFTAVTAHELVTPVTYLQAALALADEIVKGKGGGNALPQMKRVIEDSFARLSRLAKNTALLNSLNSFDLKMRGTPAPLMGTLEATLSTARAEIERHKRKIIMETDDLARLERAWILCDPILIDRLFTELLSNAVKYTPDNGQIEARWKFSGNSVTINITDHGIGLSPAELERVLHPYFSTREIEHHYTSDYAFMGGGMGIGLVLAHRIASLHHAQFAITSQGKGTGTTVTVCFPLCE